MALDLGLAEESGNGNGKVDVTIGAGFLPRIEKGNGRISAAGEVRGWLVSDWRQKAAA